MRSLMYATAPPQDFNEPRPRPSVPVPDMDTPRTVHAFGPIRVPSVGPRSDTCTYAIDRRDQMQISTVLGVVDRVQMLHA